MLMRQIVSVLFVALLLPLASAQFNQAVWDTITNDNFEEKLSPQAIAVNGYEQFHLVYAKNLNTAAFSCVIVSMICWRGFLRKLSPIPE
jgi:hypothetical protein